MLFSDLNWQFRSIERISKIFNRLPNLFPFASIGTNAYYCFDFSHSTPSIVYLDPNNTILEENLSEDDLKVKDKESWLTQGIIPLFVSFEDLLKSLVIDLDDFEDYEYLIDDEFQGWKDFYFNEKR